MIGEMGTIVDTLTETEKKGAADEEWDGSARAERAEFLGALSEIFEAF